MNVKRNPNTSKFLLWSPHMSKYTTQEFVDIILSKYKSGEYNDWAIVLKKTNKMIYFKYTTFIK